MTQNSLLLLTTVFLAAHRAGAAPVQHPLISKSRAQELALQQAPQGTVLSAELEKEHGALVWSFDIRPKQSGGDIIEVQVDAKTGGIVSTEIENPAKQAEEARKDKVPSSH